MARFRMDDLKSIETAPTSPISLNNKLGGVILSSTQARCRVDSIDPDTGEYRVVLEGTLDREADRFGDG